MINTYLLFQIIESVLYLLPLLIIILILRKKTPGYEGDIFAVKAFLLGWLWFLIKRKWKAFFIIMLYILLSSVLTLFLNEIENGIRLKILAVNYNSMWTIEAIFGQMNVVLSQLFFGFLYPIVKYFYDQKEISLKL